MTDEFGLLRQRVDRLEDGVGAIRETLRHCLLVADQPENALTLARRIIDGLTARVIESLGEKERNTLDANIRVLESDAVLSRGLVPGEIITLLHMIRVIGNKAAHDRMNIAAGPADVDLVLRSVLRVVEWFFAEFKRGPRLDPLFGGPAPPPRLESPGLPPAVRLPALVVAGPNMAPDAPIVEPRRRKVFVFTDRIIGLGRQKTSRDARVHIVTRLLPAPDPSHPNWAANLENISQFHAQLWWQLGRAEIRDEHSDKGVLVDDRPIAPGVWTLCSLPDPPVVRLGPRGVAFTVRELVRHAGGLQVLCLQLQRLDAYPMHEYLLVGHPLVTVGSAPASVIRFEGVAGTAATLGSGERGWELRMPDAEPVSIGPGREYPLGATGLSVKRASEHDFLT